MILQQIDSQNLIIIQQEHKIIYISIAGCFFLLAFIVLISGNASSFKGFLLCIPSLILGISIIFAVPLRKIHINTQNKIITIYNKVFFTDKSSKIFFKQISNISIEPPQLPNHPEYRLNIIFKNGSNYHLLKDSNNTKLEHIMNFITSYI